MQENDQQPNETQTPGDAIRVELTRRGWGQADLARVLRRPLPTVNEIIQGKKAITPDMAVALGDAFGDGAEKWMALESAYRLSLVRESSQEVRRRARLFQMAPIKEMERRLWIRSTKSDEELESELCRFFSIESAEEEPRLSVVARKTDESEPLSPAQRAWCYRAANLARSIQASPYDHSRISEAKAALRELASHPEGARHVPRTLADFGIRFVIVEPLQGTRIDGAAFWLSESMPVIAASTRTDRIDGFWFTLFHEMSHIEHRDSLSVDSNMIGEDSLPAEAKEAQEMRADADASTTLVPAAMLDSFILRVGPLYSKDRIVQFAHRIKIHPGIVVGQLQFRGELSWSSLRQLLPRVRDIVAKSALTDGWGHVPSNI